MKPMSSQLHKHPVLGQRLTSDLRRFVAMKAARNGLKHEKGLWVLGMSKTTIHICLVMTGTILCFHILGIVIQTDPYVSEEFKPPTRYHMIL